MASRELQIELLPGRKRKAIVLIDGGRLIPLAYFVKDEYVDMFMDMCPRYLPDDSMDDRDVKKTQGGYDQCNRCGNYHPTGDICT